MTIFKNTSIIVLLVGMLFLSCEKKHSLTIAGRIVYVGLEGGFYGIYSDDGVGYDPVNLPTDFQQDSLRVLFEGNILTEQASTHMWGTLIELKRIEKQKQ
jgi:hypothetical protein